MIAFNCAVEYYIITAVWNLTKQGSNALYFQMFKFYFGLYFQNLKSY